MGIPFTFRMPSSTRCPAAPKPAPGSNNSSATSLSLIVLAILFRMVLILSLATHAPIAFRCPRGALFTP